jgi:hypothetical protein
LSHRRKRSCHKEAQKQTKQPQKAQKAQMMSLPLKTFVPFVPYCGYSFLSVLAAYRVANIFNRFPDFPSGLAEAFLYVAARIICAALGFEIPVIDSSANSLLGFAFGLIKFSFDFVSIR